MIATRIAALLLLTGIASAQKVAPEKLPAADATLQAGLQRLLDAPSAAEQRQAFEFLRANAGAAHARLVPQLFRLAQLATDTREAMLEGVVLAELQVPADDVIHALVPLFDGADAALRAALGGVLSEYEERSGEHGADFSVYRALLAAGPSDGFVRYLLETDPGAGFLALTRAVHWDPADPRELRALLWAEHAVADALWKRSHGFVSADQLARATPEAVTQLGVLARHPRWWARLYALQVAADEAGLRSALPLELLAHDENAQVRELAASLRSAR
ncbi:MAG: hypothetical protein EXS08_10630 [Planctomycetes bacterium]|nr:hypothetical protein [Planctomycetota bacterium]